MRKVSQVQVLLSGKSINIHELEESSRIRVEIQRRAISHCYTGEVACQFFSVPAQPKVSIGHQARIDGAIMAENIFLIANSMERCKRNVEKARVCGFPKTNSDY